MEVPGMGMTVVVLLAVSVALASCAVAMSRVLPAAQDRWKRPLAILMGAMLGIALSQPVAVVLNPLVGLQVGTYHNLMILSICLGFLGFIVGSLIGLLHGGMILGATSPLRAQGTLPTTSRTTHADPACHGPSNAGSDGVVSTEKPRGADELEVSRAWDASAGPSSFQRHLAQVQGEDITQNPGGEA